MGGGFEGELLGLGRGGLGQAALRRLIWAFAVVKLAGQLLYGDILRGGIRGPEPHEPGQANTGVHA